MVVSAVRKEFMGHRREGVEREAWQRPSGVHAAERVPVFFVHAPADGPIVVGGHRLGHREVAYAVALGEEHDRGADGGGLLWCERDGPDRLDDAVL